MYPMCTHWIIPGLAPEEIDVFHSVEEERREAFGDEHHVVLDCSGYADARHMESNIVILYKVISPRLAPFSTNLDAIGWPFVL